MSLPLKVDELVKSPIFTKPSRFNGKQDDLVQSSIQNIRRGQVDGRVLARSGSRDI